MRRIRHPDCEKFFDTLHARGESVVNLALNLAKAGALIAAEIDRLQRLQPKVL